MIQSAIVDHYSASTCSNSALMGNANLKRPSAHPLTNPHSLSGPADYNIIRTIRQSIYGKVRLATLRSQPAVHVALKISSLAHVRARTTLEDPEQETRIMRLLSANGGHPHVLKLFDDFIQADSTSGQPKYHWQVLEFCSRGELFDIIDSMKGKSGIGEGLARRFFSQLVSGLQFIHSRGVAHLDISPENVLIDQDNNAKIIDFGMARLLPSDGVFPASNGHRPGKLAYMAPEIFAGVQFDGRAADVYSLGVVLFTMLVGFPPYSQPSTADKRFEMIINGNLVNIMTMWGLSDKVSNEAIALMQAMLTPASKRISLEEVASHPWLRSPMNAKPVAVSSFTTNPADISFPVARSLFHVPDGRTLYPQGHFAPHNVNGLSHFDDEYHRAVQVAATRTSQFTRAPSYVLV